MDVNNLPNPTVPGLDRETGRIAVLGGPRPGVYTFKECVIAFFSV